MGGVIGVPDPIGCRVLPCVEANDLDLGKSECMVSYYAVTKYHKLHGIKEEHWESLSPTLVSLGYN